MPIYNTRDPVSNPYMSCVFCVIRFSQSGESGQGQDKATGGPAQDDPASQPH